MKIALIAGSKIPSRTANSIQTMKMAQGIMSLGHSVRLYVPRRTANVSWDEIAQHYGVQNKIDIHWLSALPRLRSYDFGIRALHQALGWDADLIYTRLPQAAAYASWRGVPTIYEIHDIPGGRFGPLLLRTFLRGGNARRLVVITHALADDIRTTYHHPNQPGFTVIAPDGVDLERYKDLPAPRKARQLLGLPERFTAGYTGHLYPGRGIDLILRVASRLPEFGFLVVGGEPEDVTRLKHKVDEGGLKNVTVFDFLSNKELPLYQAACDALLMPYQTRVAASSGGDISRYLSPMKMFEYLACGRVILASDLPVLQEVLVHEENALILPADDEAAWEKALRKLGADPDYKVRLGTRARESAQKFSWTARAENILSDLIP
jgi:glycosyltransferase involved in cell wall biosynthesis